MNNCVETQVIWNETHQSARTVRLPIGGKTVYVTRREARVLTKVAQVGAILGEGKDELARRVGDALEQMRSAQRNPLLAMA